MKNTNNLLKSQKISKKTLNSLNYKLNVGYFQNIKEKNQNLKLTLNEFKIYQKIISNNWELSDNSIENHYKSYYLPKFNHFQENLGFLSNIWKFNEFFKNL